MKPLLSLKAVDDLRHASRTFIERDLQILDLKHLAEFEAVYRRRCRLAITLYKDWQKNFHQETEALEMLYGSIEGMMIRRQAQDAVKLYWIIRQDFRTAFKTYLERMAKNNVYATRIKKAA